MRLKKSYDDNKLIYTLSFEISPTELIAAGGANAWKSQYIADYIDMLQKIAGVTGKAAKKKQRFEDIMREAQRQAYSSTNQFQQAYQESFNQAYYGAFNSSQSSQQTPPHQAPPRPKPAWATVLGVEATATKDEIKARYRTLAKQNHPDRGGDPAKFAKISEAYEQATK